MNYSYYNTKKIASFLAMTVLCVSSLRGGTTKQSSEYQKIISLCE